MLVAGLILQPRIHTGSSFGLSINLVSYIIDSRIVAKYDVGQGSPTLNSANYGCSTKLMRRWNLHLWGDEDWLRCRSEPLPNVLEGRAGTVA